MSDEIWVSNKTDICAHGSNDTIRKHKPLNDIDCILNPISFKEKYEVKMSKSHREVRQISVVSSKARNKTCFKRWGKDKDKLAFEMLQTLCSENSINVDQFMQVDVSEIIDECAEMFANNAKN